ARPSSADCTPARTAGPQAAARVPATYLSWSTVGCGAHPTRQPLKHLTLGLATATSRHTRLRPPPGYASAPWPAKSPYSLRCHGEQHCRLHCLACSRPAPCTSRWTPVPRPPTSRPSPTLYARALRL